MTPAEERTLRAGWELGLGVEAARLGAGVGPLEAQSAFACWDAVAPRPAPEHRQRSASPPPPRAWTRAEERELLALRASGVDFEAIGAALGGRTASSARARHRKLRDLERARARPGRTARRFVRLRGGGPAFSDPTPAREETPA